MKEEKIEIIFKDGILYRIVLPDDWDKKTTLLLMKKLTSFEKEIKEWNENNEDKSGNKKILGNGS